MTTPPRAISRGINILAVLGGALVLVVALSLIVPEKKHTDASASHNLVGFAWSDKIGWISFNCTNLSECGTSDYGVTINEQTGLWSGQAWNSEVGWIDFAPSLPPGQYPENPKEDARANTTTGAVTGWARAVMNADSNPGTEWDGFIKLAGPSGTWTGVDSVTVPIMGGTLSGYAWGGDETGWIAFGPDNGFGGVTFTGTFNRPPTAFNDVASVNQNGTVLVNVIANDTDPDGDPLTVISVTNPPHGTAAIESNQVRYTPQANYAGSDAFNYTISDGRGGESAATVGVTVFECGNNVRELNEQCDQTAFGGDTCRDYGFVGGVLSCAANCTVITTACKAAGEGKFEEF